MPEWLTRRNPDGILPGRYTRLALVWSALVWVPPSAHATVGYWGQAQSHLEAFADKPLTAGNWSGRYRPYVVVDGRYVPVLEIDESEHASLDLMSPVAISGFEILLSGSEAGKPEFDIFKYDTRSKTLSNLTGTPEVDEGRVCIDATTRMISFRSRPGPSAGASASRVSIRDEQRVARVADTLRPVGKGGLSPFEDCVWLDPQTLLGIVRRGSGYELHRCRVTGDTVSCEPRRALAGIEAVTGFLEPSARNTDVIARRRGDLFRAPFILSEPFDALAPAVLPPDVKGDVLDRQGDVFRVGFQGRYTSSLAPQSSATVYVTRKIGATTFAIVATDRTPRTLARLNGTEWELLRHPSAVMPGDPALPREMWMSSAAGGRYQAFAFGAWPSARVIVWWHGGPQESVSPRFNPYFQRLHELGFGVLAVNYPGSTGRGAPYEKSFTTDALADCIDAVWSYLRDNGARTVISWSVSSGVNVQRVLLGRGSPLSAVVDQSAWGRSNVLDETRNRHIPFFAIRGRNDPYGPIDHVDYWYAGGHDITVAADFVRLFEAIGPFLAAVPPINWPRAAAIAEPAGPQPRDAR